MITTILALATLGLGAAPADTPITPLDESLITMGQTTTEGQGVCTAAADTGAAIDDLATIGGPEIATLLKDMAVGYFGDMLEDGMGSDWAMTPEAEASFETWIIGCLG